MAITSTVPGSTVSQIVGKICLQPAGSAAASSAVQARSMASAWTETAVETPERIAARRADLDDPDLGIGQQRAQTLFAERTDGCAQIALAFLQVTDPGANVSQLVDHRPVHRPGVGS